jgi:hypothetical protein
MVTNNGDVTDNQAPPGPRVHVKLPRIDYEAAKSAAAAAGVTVPVYLAGLIQADKIERARNGAYAMHALGLFDGTVEDWSADARSAAA